MRHSVKISSRMSAISGLALLGDCNTSITRLRDGFLSGVVRHRDGEGREKLGRTDDDGRGEVQIVSDRVFIYFFSNASTAALTLTLTVARWMKTETQEMDTWASCERQVCNGGGMYTSVNEQILYKQGTRGGRWWRTMVADGVRCMRCYGPRRFQSICGRDCNASNSVRR